jgi:hypothetical protein
MQDEKTKRNRVLMRRQREKWRRNRRSSASRQKFDPDKLGEIMGWGEGGGGGGDGRRGGNENILNCLGNCQMALYVNLHQSKHGVAPCTYDRPQP